MNILINEILLTVAVLTVGVVYGTDVFYALVSKKAAALSNDQSLADLIGHTHLVADKRMPVIGIASIISSLLLTILNYHTTVAIYSVIAMVALLAHLAIYMRIAKPINDQMTAAALAKNVPENIRALQVKWNSVIVYRALLLLLAMLALIIATFIIGRI